VLNHRIKYVRRNISRSMCMLEISLCVCVHCMKSEENEWGVNKITLQFLQGIRRNQAISRVFSLSLSIVAAPPPPTDAHPCNTHTHSQVHVHTQQFLARGVISLSLSLSLSNTDSAPADISHPRQLGHNLGLNVCFVRLYM